MEEDLGVSDVATDALADDLVPPPELKDVAAGLGERLPFDRQRALLTMFTIAALNLVGILVAQGTCQATMQPCSHADMQPCSHAAM